MQKIFRCVIVSYDFLYTVLSNTNDFKIDWICCCHEIFTFLDYLMLNPSFQKDRNCTDNGVHIFLGYLSESERYSVTGVRTRLLRCCSPEL